MGSMAWLRSDYEPLLVPSVTDSVTRPTSQIRELLTAAEYAALLKRIEVDRCARAHERAPGAAGTPGADM